MTHRIRLAAALAALALTAGALTGCSLIPDPVRDIVEQGGDGIENPLGSIPEDFPSEVPLVEGEVLVGLKVTDGAWGVTIRVADEAAASASVTLLEDAGFTALADGVTSFDKDDLNVTVAWAEADDGGGGWAVAYTVIQNLE